ncbi:hypothetical protein [Spongiimicrobium sp. 2-473A-2-J]|uniref:hypothetical protein n=1 Tax=Eudoraea algarum TaxID=3417568 RepID=UPI003D35B4D9
MSTEVKNILFPLVSMVLVISIALPSMVKLSHAIHDHLQQECTKRGAVHIHEVELDCDFQKYKLSSQFYPALYAFTVFPVPNYDTTNFSAYFFLSDYQALHFSLRGPPSLS